MKSIIICIFFWSCLVTVCPAKAQPGPLSGDSNLENGQTAITRQLTPEERKWFEKFQEGTFYADGWQSITAEILKKIPPQKQPQFKSALVQLGNKIGLEWCRDNDIRRIDTRMLQKWGKELKKAVEQNPQQLVNVIAAIDRQVNDLLD